MVYTATDMLRSMQHEFALAAPADLPRPAKLRLLPALIRRLKRAFA